MHRVCAAGRSYVGAGSAAAARAPFRRLIPLDEVLAELCGVGPQTQTVRRMYDELLKRLGPELFILEEAALDDIERKGSALLAEAIARMRQGRVMRQAGYDGEYGTIRLLAREETAQSNSARPFKLP